MIGTDPLHEMPILDLRIRKAVRRANAKLMVASERPTALDGGAAEAIRYLPGDAASFVRALAGALGAEGYDTEGPFTKEAGAIAEILRDAPDQMIVWGERLWRNPGAVEALHACARALEMHQRIGPGLLEVPEESNGRGLREVGCLPGRQARSGAPPRPDAAAPASRTASPPTSSARRCWSTRTRFAPSPTPKAGARRSPATSWSPSPGSRTSRPGSRTWSSPPRRFAEKEGTVTHPDGRLQRLRRNVPLPEGMIPGWRFLAAVAAELGSDLTPESPAEVFDALSNEVPFYDSITYEEIGGTGLRWGDRDPGQSWTPDAPPAGASAGRHSPGVPAAAPTDDTSDLVLGTYRDLWAADVTKRNPALRFLMPKQKLELAAKDAESLELSNGDAVTVAVNGHSVEATVAIRERMQQGAAFLIEGTDEANGNVLTNGVPQRIRVTKR